METLSIKVEQEHPWLKMGGIETHKVWMSENGKNIAYVRVMLNPHEYNDYFCICDIETREGYRNMGYSKKLLALVSEHFGKEVATSGTFTPDGFTAYSGKIHQLAGHPHKDEPSVSPMNFVYDWDDENSM